MIKAQEASYKNIVLFLILAAATSAAYFISHPLSHRQSVPVFAGDELVVQKTAVAAVPAKINIISKSESIKVAALPSPAPKAVVPLPIVPPSVSYRVLPVYPQSALEEGLGGLAILSVYIDLNERAGKVEIKTSSGDKMLDQSAVAAISQWHFSPALQGNSPIASWFEIPVKFEIK